MNPVSELVEICRRHREFIDHDCHEMDEICEFYGLSGTLTSRRLRGGTSRGWTRQDLKRVEFILANEFDEGAPVETFGRITNRVSTAFIVFNFENQTINAMRNAIAFCSRSEFHTESDKEELKQFGELHLKWIELQRAEDHTGLSDLDSSYFGLREAVQNIAAFESQGGVDHAVSSSDLTLEISKTPGARADSMVRTAAANGASEIPEKKSGWIGGCPKGTHYLINLFGEKLASECRENPGKTIKSVDVARRVIDENPRFTNKSRGSGSFDPTSLNKALKKHRESGKYEWPENAE